MSHSKRNTSLAFFTSYERSLLRSTWGSQATRLTRDSFLPFGSCLLCLLPSQDPVACCGGPLPASSDDSTTNVAENTTTITTANGDAKTTLKRKRGEQCHVFCRECAMANLLAQRKELKRADKEAAALKVEADEVEALHDEEAQRRAVEEFEKVQAGLDVRLPPGKRTGANGKVVGREGDSFAIIEADRNTPGGTGRSKKRKFELDEEELLRIARDDRAKARKALEDERAASAKSSMQSFWIPSMTPSSKAATITANGEEGDNGKKRKKQDTLCPGSAPTTGAAHAVSLKTLISVNFTEEDDEGASAAAKGSSDAVARTASGKIRVCPACSKPLTNASKAVLARPCGHVLCGSCVSRFVLPDSSSSSKAAKLGAGVDWDAEAAVHDKHEKAEIRCFVCSANLSAPAPAPAASGDKKKEKERDKDRIKPGLVEICTEGTGFAGSGKNLVKKHGVAFQC